VGAGMAFSIMESVGADGAAPARSVAPLQQTRHYTIPKRMMVGTNTIWISIIPTFSQCIPTAHLMLRMRPGYFPIPEGTSRRGIGMAQRKIFSP